MTDHAITTARHVAGALALGLAGFVLNLLSSDYTLDTVGAVAVLIAMSWLLVLLVANDHRRGPE